MKKQPLASPFADADADDTDTAPKSGAKKTDDAQSFFQNLKNKTKKRISASSHKERSTKSMKNKPAPFMKASAK